MTEDPTKKLNGEKAPPEDRLAGLSDRQLLETILAQLAALETRFEGRETNPLLPPNFAERFVALEERMDTVETELKGIRAEQRVTNQKLGKLALDVLETHAQQQDLAWRMDAFERRPS